MVDYYKEFGLEKNATESQIRDAVGAPSREEEEKCVCGKDIDKCSDAYSHMSGGY
tara:strand:+ start:396 stop:560 length:165 start_codon:yes stop_codon:yes gene_type:complete